MKHSRRTFVIATLAFTLAGIGSFAHADAVATGPTIRDAWARATPPGAGVAAVYLTIAGGTRADRVTGVSTDRASAAHVHEVTRKDGVSQMRPIDALPVPAGGRVVLAPEGLHLMLMGLTRPLVAGERFDVTFVFEHAGRITAPVTVVAPGAPTPATR